MENVSPVPIPTLSKNMDEQFKLTHKVVGVVDQANKKICLTLLGYNVDNPETRFAQVRLFIRKKEDENSKKKSL